MEPDAMLAEVVDWIRNHYFGKYRGIVRGTADENSQGRLEVEVPAVLGTARVWAMPSVPYAGDGVGFYALPDEGTGVWVEFEGGDPTYPIWTGCFWGSGQLPDSPGAAVKVLRTNSHTIRLDDDGGELLIAADSGGESLYSSDVVHSAGESEVSVSSLGVTATKGAGSVEITDAATTVKGTSVSVG